MLQDVSVHQCDQSASQREFVIETVREAALVYQRNFTDRCKHIVERMRARYGGTWHATGTRRRMTSRFQYTKGSMIFFNLDGVHYQVYKAPPVAMEREPTRVPPTDIALPSPLPEGVEIRKSTLSDAATAHCLQLAMNTCSLVSSEAARDLRDVLQEFYGAPWHVYLSSSESERYVFGCYIVHNGEYFHFSLPGGVDLYAFKSTSGATSGPPSVSSHSTRERPLGAGMGPNEGDSAFADRARGSSKSTRILIAVAVVWAVFAAWVVAFTLVPLAYGSISAGAFTSLQAPLLCSHCADKYTNCMLTRFGALSAEQRVRCQAALTAVPSAKSRVCSGSTFVGEQSESMCVNVTQGFWIVVGVGAAVTLANLIGLALLMKRLCASPSPYSLYDERASLMAGVQ